MDALGSIGHRVGVSDNMEKANILIWKLIVSNTQDQANQELILNAKKTSHATPLWKSLPAIVDILRMGASGRLMLAVFVINQLRNNLSFSIDISFVSQAACYYFSQYYSASFHRHKPIIHFC